MRDEREIFLRHGVTDRVGDIDRRGAGIDRGLDAAAQEIVLGARAVFRRPFHVVHMVARARDLLDHHFIDFVRLLLELPLHMHRRSREERVNARPPRMLHGLGAAIDVLRARARQPAITAFLRAPAISETDSKSPCDAIGNPASMMSTPISSSSSATSSFSSKVMDAPGHCSPSRKVVSKMTDSVLVDIAHGEFPMLVGLIEAFQEPIALFLPRDIKEELDRHDAVARDVALERGDVLETLAPDILGYQSIWYLLPGEEFRMDAYDEHFLIIGTVEDTDASALGQTHGGSPHEFVIEFLRARRLERVHGDALRINPRHHMFDGAILSGRVHRLENQ
jgi:hypothetical protein